MLRLKSTLRSETFATRKFHEFSGFWVNSRTFMKTEILFWLIRTWFFFMKAKILFWLVRESLCLQFFFFFQKLTFFKTFFEPLFTLILFYHLIEKLSWPWESFFPRSQIMGFSNKFYKNSTFLTEFKTKINTWAADHCWPPSLQKKYIGRGIFI